MRCNNCGYENKTGMQNCEKCNTPLKALSNVALNENNSISKSVANTIQGSEIQAEPWDCPQCGRPIIPGSKQCNNCSYIFNNNKNEIFREKNVKHKGTIDPYSKGFILKPISTEYDNNNLEEIKIKANDDEIEVGRDLLEPDNVTISSKQAVFANKNGKWYVKDISKHNTTFIYAKDFIEIDEGDIILIGNRKFIFSK